MENQMHMYWWFITAIIPILVGFVWYNPKVFGTAWMQATGLTMESGKNMNMPLILGVSYILGIMISIMLSTIVIHQMGVISLFQKDPTNPLFAQVMRETASNFRTYRHGALHGTIAALFFALPIIATSAIWEQRGWKYIMIGTGYWVVTLAIMGAILCHWM